MVHVSQEYKNMDITKKRISLILELMAIFLSFQMTFSLLTAAVPGLSWRAHQALILHPIP